MRRPRSLLVALLGACLILGACNQGGSTESSETDEPAATATTAAQEPTSSAPGVSVRRRTDIPAPPSPNAFPSPTPSPSARPSPAPAPAGYTSVSAPTAAITFAVPADWSAYNTFDDATTQEIADHLGTDVASVRDSTGLMDLMTLAPSRDSLGVMEGVLCLKLVLPLDATTIESTVRKSASESGGNVDVFTSTESANGTVYYGIVSSPDNYALVGHVYLPNSSGSYVTTYIYASSTERVQELISVIAATLRLELVGEPVRIIEIAPGMVATEEFSLNRFHGDRAAADAVYAGVEAPLTASDVAECIVWALERPARVNIDSLIVRPRAQASNTVVARH